MAVLAATTYVVVCRGPACRERGGLHLRKRLVNLMKGETNACLLGYACFGQCDFGPNVAFFPEAVWCGGLSASDAERIHDYAVGIVACPPGEVLDLPVVERSQHVANVADLIATVERDTAKRNRGHWWWPF